MNSGDYTYIWQSSDWLTWRFDLETLAQPLADVSRAQGLLMGRLADVGMALRDVTDLLARGILRRSDAAGRSTNYELNGASK